MSSPVEHQLHELIERRPSDAGAHVKPEQLAPEDRLRVVVPGVQNTLRVLARQLNRDAANTRIPVDSSAYYAGAIASTQTRQAPYNAEGVEV